MNNGMYGFPTGPQATFRELIFDSSDNYYPDPNCKYIIIDMSGGGGGGASTTAGGTAGAGGCAGTPYQGIIPASFLGHSNRIDIGLGGAASTNGSDTVITNNDTKVELMRVAGGRTSSNLPYTIVGNVVSNGFRGGQGGGAGSVGGEGAGGGGGGSAGGTTAFTGGRPSSMLFQSTALTNADRSGGGATNVSGQNAPNASRTVREYGEGAGGAGRIAGGFAGNGGNGIRGSGGGGAGVSTANGATGGSGGNGFVRILEVSFP